jgi:hypothetical protein
VPSILVSPQSAQILVDSQGNEVQEPNQGLRHDFKNRSKVEPKRAHFFKTGGMLFCRLFCHLFVNSNNKKKLSTHQ